VSIRLRASKRTAVPAPSAPTARGPRDEVDETSAGVSAPSLRVGRVAQYARPLGIFTASRAGMLLVLAALGYVQHVGISHLLLDWDSAWYLQAAQHGYPSAIPPGTGNAAQTTLGFFPALPILIHLVAVVTRVSYDVAGFAVGFIAGALGAVATWRLVNDYSDARGADQGTAFVCFAPGAFVLSMVYSEGLLICFVATALLSLRRGRWVLAGILAAAATATDPLGIAVVAPCAVAAFVAIRRDREWRALWAPLLAPGGVVIFFSYLWVHVGTPLAWFIDQRRGWQVGSFGTGLANEFGYVFEHGLVQPNDTVRIACCLLCVALLVAFVRIRPGAVVISYVLGVLVLALLSPVTGFSPRVALRAFPLFGIVGARVKGPWATILLGLSMLAMAAMAVLSLGASGPPWTPP
jgi:hypothetical protein